MEESQMPVVFISYRRDETSGEARALYKDLVASLGEESVFMDVDSIALGRDFREALQERLISCDILLVLIGKKWLYAGGASEQRRLDDPDDFVRQEIASALKRNIPVTPVLLQGVQMPSADELPEELQNLAYRNGFEISHRRWESDVQDMIVRLRLVAGKVPAAGRRSTVVPESIKKSWLAIVGLLLALVILSGALFFGNITDQDSRGSRTEENRHDILSLICPVGFKGCSKNNLCSSCFQSCGFCQNLNQPSCGAEDCMTCKEGYRLVQIYGDGTGRCVLE